MNFDLYFYWKLFLRRLPVMALLLTVCGALGAFTAIRLPATYSTAARLLVEDPQIPDSMVTSTVRTSAAEQLNIIQQRLTTRANVIDIANQYNVFENIREISPDDVVAQMRDATTIRLTSGRNQALVMTISFRGRSGQVVSNVVNEYVSLVLEANVDFRVSRAESTLEFFEQEVDRLSEQLDEQSVRITIFKSENAHALPDNQPYRLARQSLLQERLALLERNLAAATTQRADLEQIFQETGSISPNTRVQPRTAEEQQLLVARTDLELALLTYSAENPRVIRLQSVVDRLEAIIASQSGTTSEDDTNEAPLTAAEAMFQATMTQIDSSMRAMQTDIAQASEEIETLQVAISASSGNEIQLGALQRDYDNIQTRYNAAVANLNEARVSERIETTAQGRRITVIEDAVVPSAPSGPNRARIVIMGAGLGLGLAGGFFVLLEILNRSIRRPAELVGRFNIVPIMTIPYLESRGHRLRRRLVLMITTLIVIIGAPLALWYIDTHYMPLDIFVQKVLSRLGLG
ncbi:chain length-determining protein [Octadecabacter sp. 1_MG-2023]|uniref:GumC family protein n=1 Tax=unclassified Octadecabacter TaxID=196158 RepID=UPI001C0854AD|nr:MULTISPECIES: chain length-determining protein [unclassified Octadecabacter]MBU2993993.1 chain length-determining protein [Octadecabacter sp. B2R22]MDO6736064.1 chain length-determining protein [Octadecabacter sp. 1_MG-2023]